jgi:hypothetical protein
MSRPEVTITVVECVAETDEAILCIVKVPDEGYAELEVWVPRSVIGDEEGRDSSFKGDVDFELSVQKWFADQEDIPYEE